ncbi:hypothetical protein Rsub_02197 [Raphidocelis subcapitata]|uniref:EF-hand domain-containing protein n=1 Tax=Raphidocelis subcapitata TaxID=307507 RepID=A0A2V0NUS2_9CHLO|nr:hypothetical protein Rsub_02197 [Raphidocelis subcapitata]|eukprot:GBF89320.1 hypothetical protein Rsub_02197 [Raphidocelis subcapitata]
MQCHQLAQRPRLSGCNGTRSIHATARNALGLQRPRTRADLACRTLLRAAAEEPSSGQDAAAPAPAPAAAPAALAAAAPPAPKAEPLGVLKAAAPVDRLRYQGLLLFDHFDADGDGQLSSMELKAFFTYAARKLMWSPGLSEVLRAVEAEAMASIGGGACSRERFLQLVRDQVRAVSQSPDYQRNDMRPDDAARLRVQTGLTAAEVCGAKWVFTLLDFDADGKLQLADLQRAAGVESYYYESQLADADDDEDGAIVFEEFLVSYARPKPVWKNLAIMVANAMAIFLLFQSPLDLMIKCVLVGALFLRPQIVSRPVSAIYDAIAALIGGTRARAGLAQGGGGGGGGAARPAVWRAA